MKKIIVAALAALLIVFSGCGNIGEDPLPFPGPEGGTVVLFRNGTVYNFDYTVQYDGLQIPEYEELKPELDGDGKPTGNTAGGPYTSLSSTDGGGYLGTKSMLFEHDLRGNYEASWLVTLFDKPPILAVNYTYVTYRAKFGAGLEPDVVQPPALAPAVTIRVWGSSGVELTSTTNTAQNTNSITNDKRDGEWYEYTVPLDIPSRDPRPEWFRSDELIKQWQITVPQNAGRIYIDEIVLH